MTWRELSDFLHLQRRAIEPRLVADFARIGEKRADTFKRLEKATRESLDEAVRKFAKTKKWPTFSDEQVTMLYLRLAEGKFRDIAEYCLRDVRATVELYKIWKERLAGIK
jgi:hypothetical protein